MNELTNVTTGEVRLSYVHLFKPYAYQPGQEEKYQVTVLVPKTDTDTMGRINAAIEAAKQRGISENPMAWPSGLSAKAIGCSQPAPRQTIHLR